MKLVRLSLVIASAALLLMIPKVNLAYLLAVSVLFFAFNAFLRPTVSTLIANSAGDRQGYAAGLSTTYTSIGSILGPVIAGQLFDWQLNTPYILGAVILVLALVLTVRTANNKRKGTALHD